MKSISSHKSQGLLFVLTLALAGGVSISSGIAQPPQQNKVEPAEWKVKKTGPRNLKVKPRETDANGLSERVIEDQIPSHVPIKVELQNLDSEKLLDMIAVKVTNVSKKPIYFLDLEILLPDVLSRDGKPIGFPLRYGRLDLIQFDKPLRPDDVPIQPGGVHIFKVDERSLEGFKQYADDMSLTQLELKTVYFFFYSLNFGDGTGFAFTDGQFIDLKKKGQMTLVPVKRVERF
jgi:hypothetical protein